jgi:hypothetical protein
MEILKSLERIKKSFSFHITLNAENPPYFRYLPTWIKAASRQSRAWKAAAIRPRTVAVTRGLEGLRGWPGVMKREVPNDAATDQH